MNIYFVVMARSTTQAEAIAEAAKLAEHMNVDTGVDVLICGTQTRIAKVLKDGTVSFPTDSPRARE